MIRVESQNIYAYDKEQTMFEVYLAYDTPEEEDAIYEEFSEFMTEGFDAGEVLVGISKWDWGDTKKEFLKEIRKRVRELNKYGY